MMPFAVREDAHERPSRRQVRLRQSPKFATLAGILGVGINSLTSVLALGLLVHLWRTGHGPWMSIGSYIGIESIGLVLGIVATGWVVVHLAGEKCLKQET
jgi:hypothetical protein